MRSSLSEIREYREALRSLQVLGLATEEKSDDKPTEINYEVLSRVKKQEGIRKMAMEFATIYLKKKQERDERLFQEQEVSKSVNLRE